MNDSASALSALEGFNLLFGLALAGVVGILIGRDAESRGMNGVGWGLFTFLVCIVAVPIYLVVRRPRLDEHPQT